MRVKVRPFRNGGWEVDIRIRLPDGSVHRRRLKAPVNAKSAALRWGDDYARHWYQELIMPARAPTKEAPTLEEFAPKVLEDAEANRQKPSGIASKETILRVHLVRLFGAIRLDEFSDEHVRQLKLALRDKAPKTVNNALNVFSVLLKKAVAWGVIDRMPCSIRLLPVMRSEATFHDFAAYERLVDAARTNGWRTHLIVLLGAEAGLRCGEMVALEWPDIDFARSRMYIRASDWRGQVTTPKNGRTRYVGMTTRLAGALKEYRHLRSTRVLCKDDGQPITRQSAWGRVRRAARRANVPTGVHILRHTFCSHLAMHGAPSRAIQELVGHQDLTMTQRYMHLSSAAVDRTIRLLERRSATADDGDIVETTADDFAKDRS